MRKSPRERRVLITGLGMSAVAAAVLHRLQDGEVLTEPGEKAVISRDDEFLLPVERLADLDLSEVELRALALGEKVGVVLHSEKMDMTAYTVSNAVPDSDSYAKAKLQALAKAAEGIKDFSTEAEKKAFLANLTAEMERVVIDNRRQQNAPTRHAQTKEAARRLRQMERKKK